MAGPLTSDSPVSASPSLSQRASGGSRSRRLAIPYVLFAGFTASAAVPVLTLASYAQAQEVTQAAAAVTVLGLVAAALFSWCFSKYIARPLRAVSDAASVVAQGNLSARAPECPGYLPDEIHSLTGAFNRMIDEVSRQNQELAGVATRAETSNRAKSEFLANMSHELRTPLNAIHGFSQMLRDEAFGPLPNERYKSYAEDISNSAQHLIKVITDILDLSKAEAGVITPDNEPVSIPEVIALAVRLTDRRAVQRQVAVSSDITPALSLTPIETDQGKLTQILLNLLTNSIKFTEPGGKITVAAQLEADHVQIAVSDTGIGIAESDLAKVMTPFGQVASAYQSHEGFGLGLPLSKRLTEALGGTFHLASVFGQGTTATIRLPRDLAEAAPHALARVA